MHLCEYFAWQIGAFSLPILIININCESMNARLDQMEADPEPSEVPSLPQDNWPKCAQKKRVAEFV